MARVSRSGRMVLDTQASTATVSRVVEGISLGKMEPNMMENSLKMIFRATVRMCGETTANMLANGPRTVCTVMGSLHGLMDVAMRAKNRMHGNGIFTWTDGRS